jgi:DHA2 family multidrug resistance protein
LDLREKLHSLRLGEMVTAYSPTASERLAGLAQQFVARGAETVAAANQALGAVAGTLRREAYTMAYSDCFFLLGALLLTMILPVWLCKPAKGGTIAH